MTHYTPPIPTGSRRVSRLLFVIAALLTGIGVAPLFSAGIAQAIATDHGCRLDEGSVHVCMVAGRDMGGVLYTMAVAGWLALVTIWLAMIAPLLWIAGFVTWLNERKGGVR